MPEDVKRAQGLKMLVATTNRKKLEELRDLLRDLEIELFSLTDFPDIKEVPETGKSFDENAILKAEGYASQTGFLTLGEDSGLCCDALEGAPGIYSARFAGEGKDDQANNDKLLRLLNKVPVNCRSAHYVSVVALADPGQLLKTVRGEVHGVIATEPKGSGGFGYDPIFYYPPYESTFGEVSAGMKHKVSHRSEALRKLKDFLKEYLEGKN